MDIFLNILKLLGALGIIGGVGWLLKIAITHKATEFASEKRINALEKENSDLEQMVVSFKEENIKLKKQTSQKPFTKDPKFGYYVDESNHIYCPPCYEDKDKRISLQPCGNKEYGWECPICKNVVKNPNYSLHYPKPPQWHPFG